MTNGENLIWAELRTVIKILKANESIIRLGTEKSNYLYSEKEISSDTIKLLIWKIIPPKQIGLTSVFKS